MKNDFAYLVLEIVQEIPKGKVASYKQIAALAGKPKNARQVGKILSHAEFYGDYPCHRVVNAVGRLVEGWQEQHILLKIQLILNICIIQFKILLIYYI